MLFQEILSLIARLRAAPAAGYDRAMEPDATAEVRLGEHKAASFGPARRASCRFGFRRVGCDRISFAAEPPGTEDRDQQLRYPGNVGSPAANIHTRSGSCLTPRVEWSKAQGMIDLATRFVDRTAEILP
jgi:hypothetical protein